MMRIGRFRRLVSDDGSCGESDMASVRRDEGAWNPRDARLFNQVVARQVESKDFNLGFGRYVGQLLKGVVARRDITAGQEEKMGGCGLGNDLGACKGDLDLHLSL